MKHNPPALQYLNDELAQLQAAGLLRTRHPSPAGPIPSFCSNDYLGLANHIPPQDIPSGAAGSRLLAGDSPAHIDLECLVAAWQHVEASLVYPSGWAANTGTLPALARPNDLVVSDALNHASTVDACRLSRATIVIVPHLDLEAVTKALRAPRTGRAFVLTESYFSMDADTPDLPTLRRICDDHAAALLVDEAHALGIFGPDGRGLCSEHQVVPDALIGTFGKAFGSAGAFVAGSQALIDWLYNRSRPFVFSTGISPVVAAAASRSLSLTLREPALRQRALANAALLRARLREAGLLPLGHGPTVPILMGDPQRALDVASSLRHAGVIAHAVRPPTVPVGTSRLRLTVTAAHTEEHIDLAVRALLAALASHP